MFRPRQPHPSASCAYTVLKFADTRKRVIQSPIDRVFLAISKIASGLEFCATQAEHPEGMVQISVSAKAGNQGLEGSRSDKSRVRQIRPNSPPWQFHTMHGPKQVENLAPIARRLPPTITTLILPLRKVWCPVPDRRDPAKAILMPRNCKDRLSQFLIVEELYYQMCVFFRQRVGRQHD